VLGVALILLFSNLLLAQVEVLQPQTGAYEFFGTKKNIQPLGIGFALGVDYATADYLTFELTDSRFLFRNTGANYFLVANSGGTYLADPDGDGTNEWAFFTGGWGNNTVVFYLADGVSPFTAIGNTWYMCTADNVADPNTSPMLIEVPAMPSPGAYKIKTSSTRTGQSFDPGTAETYFTSAYQWDYTVTEVEDTIDVEQARKFFLTPAGDTDSVAVGSLTDAGAFDYDTNVAVMGEANPYWEFTVSGDMQGVEQVQILQLGILATNTPTNSTTVVEVNGDDLALGANSMSVIVTGDVGLNERALDFNLDFQGDQGPNDYANRNVLQADDVWTWVTNGTIFRSVWFTTARDGVNYTSFRIANLGDSDADVYAEVWMDDGNEVTTPVQVGTVPKDGGLFKITGYNLVDACGLTPVYTITGQGWKGRVRFTVWGPRKEIFGVGLNWVSTASGIGYTRIPLEKQTPSDETYWQK